MKAVCVHCCRGAVHAMLAGGKVGKGHSSSWLSLLLHGTEEALLVHFLSWKVNQGRLIKVPAVDKEVRLGNHPIAVSNLIKVPWESAFQ